MTNAQKGQVLAGKYRIERVLGSGGMGEVVAARHVDLQRDVALKFLHPSLLSRTDLVERFLREARALARLESEHAVRVMDVAKLEDGSPYMVMELLRGSDLHSVLDKGPLPVDQSIEYVLQAAEALAEAHGLGIVHRDLKPSNLFLAQRPDGSHIVKVLDFGISKITMEEAGPDASVTATNSFLGSPRYMSPEQIRSAKNVDRRTDIWSLGVVLYELVTGKHPFEAETVAEVIGLVLHHVPPPPSAHRPEIPPELDAVVARCLQKDRELRFPDLAAFAEALGALAPPRACLSMERVVRLASLTPPALDESEAPQHRTETHPSPVEPVGAQAGAAPAAQQAASSELRRSQPEAAAANPEAASRRSRAGAAAADADAASPRPGAPPAKGGPLLARSVPPARLAASPAGSEAPHAPLEASPASPEAPHSPLEVSPAPVEAPPASPVAAAPDARAAELRQGALPKAEASPASPVSAVPAALGAEPARPPEERTLTASAWGDAAPPTRPRTRRRLVALGSALLVATLVGVLGTLASRSDESAHPVSASASASVFGSLEPSDAEPQSEAPAASVAPAPPLVAPAPDPPTAGPEPPQSLVDPEPGAPPLATEEAPPSRSRPSSRSPSPSRSQKQPAAGASSVAAPSGTRRSGAGGGAAKSVPRTPGQRQNASAPRTAPTSTPKKAEWEQEWLEKRVIGR